MTSVWIVVAIFAIFAIGWGAVQAMAALADRRRGREVAHDEERVQPTDRRR
jgi:hypothetical protein